MASLGTLGRVLWRAVTPFRHAQEFSGWLDLIPYGTVAVGFLGAWIFGLPLAWAVTVGLSIGLGLALFAAFSLQIVVDSMSVQPHPNVVFDGFDSVRSQQITTSTISQSNIAEFARLRFVNEPDHPGAEAAVPDLHARIEIHRTTGEQVLLLHDGRWADNFDRGEAPSRYTKSVPIPGTGESRILDIVMQRRDDDDCYGWDHNGFQMIDSPIPPGTYEINVELSGSNMKKSAFQFSLTNQGRAGYLELAERPGVTNPCSTRWRSENT